MSHTPSPVASHRARRLALTAALLAAVGLVGCGTTSFTGSQILERWNPGANQMYGVVTATAPLSEKSHPLLVHYVRFCAGDTSSVIHKEEGFAPSVLSDGRSSVCSELGNPNSTAGFVFVNYYNHPWRGFEKQGNILTPRIKDVAPNDIVEYRLPINSQGQLTTIPRVIRVAAKASAPRADCYWAGGSYALAGVTTQGVICDGWDFRQQRFAGGPGTGARPAAGGGTADALKAPPSPPSATMQAN